MEEVINALKKEFKENNYKERTDKLACAIGYLQVCDNVNKQETIQIIKKIFFGEI